MGPGLPRLVAPSLSAEGRDFSISALGTFITALSRRVSALSGGVTKRGNFCAVLYSTVQDLLFVIKKKENQTRNTNGGARDVITGWARASPFELRF